MKSIFIKVNFSFFLLIVFLFLNGCVKDHTEKVRIETEELEMAIMIRIPGAATPTRVLTDNDENWISTIDLLVFEDNGTGNPETFLYVTHGTDFENSGTTAKVKIGLKKSDNGKKHRFVMLANARAEVDAVRGTFTSTMTKDEVLETILFNVYETSQTLETDRIWNTTGTPPRYLPMWGEAAQTYMVTETLQASHIGTISMLRAVAAVDIVLNPDGSSQPQGFPSLFRLKDVKVYNASRQGHVVPDADKLTALKADDPTVPAGVATGKIAYHALTATQTDQFGLVREIYIAESANTDNGGNNLPDADQVCLLISGYYKNDVNPTWYRMDFLKSKTTYERWDILRNHRYTFYITAVDGPGYGTEEEAANSMPMNIDNQVIAWDEGDMGDVVFDGQYMLSVSQAAYEFTKEERTSAGDDNKLTIFTDHPSNWKITRIIDQGTQTTAAWLSTDITTGAANSKTTVRLLATENTSGSSRSAKLTIVAGRLEYTVTIVQTAVSMLKIIITDEYGNDISDLAFGSGIDIPILSQKLNLEWYPKDADCHISLSLMGTDAFDFGSGDVIAHNTKLDAATYNGQHQYTINPNALTAAQIATNPLYDRGSVVSFTVSNETNTVTKNFYFRQFNYDVLIEDFVWAARYGKASKTHPFTVKSNTDWVLSVDNTAGVLTTSSASQLHGLIGGPSATGVTLSYSTNSVATLNEQSVITVSSPTGKFADKKLTVTMGQVERNCFMIAPGGSVQIQARKAWWVWGEELLKTGVSENNDDLTVEVLWTDVAGLVSSCDFASKNGRKSVINVTTNAAAGTGNAVVALKVRGEIRWSWHIWVTDYNPQAAGAIIKASTQHGIITSGGVQYYITNTEMMDRDLGSKSKLANASGVEGLFYQWGRKDPFPRVINYRTDKRHYLPASWETVYGVSPQFVNVTELHNLGNSIVNPMYYYQTGSDTYDWYTNGTESYQNDNLWRDENDEITHFEPCPEGWRTPSIHNVLYQSESLPLSGYDMTNHGYIVQGSFFAYAGVIKKSGSMSMLDNGTIGAAHPYNSGHWWTRYTENISGIRTKQAYTLQSGPTTSDGVTYIGIHHMRSVFMSQRETGARIRCVTENSKTTPI